MTKHNISNKTKNTLGADRVE